MSRIEKILDKIVGQKNSHLERRKAELFFVVCLLATIPAISTSALISPLSYVPWLNIGESFGWSGIDLTAAPSFATGLPYLKVAFAAVLLAALAVFVYAFRLLTIGRSWPYFLALLPALLLVFWCSGTIGSVMQYDLAKVAGEQITHSPNWFDSVSPLPEMQTIPNSGSMTDKAKTELMNRLHLDRENNVHNLPYFVASAILLATYLYLFGLRRRGLTIVIFLAFAVALMANFSWSNSILLWGLASLYPIASVFLACVLFRFFVRSHRDNKEIFQRFSTREKFITSVFYWLPFALVAAILVYSGDRISRQVEEWTYNPDIPFEELKAKEVSLLKPVTNKRLMRDDLGISLVATVEELKNQLNNVGDQVDLDSYRRNILVTFDGVVRPSLEDYSPSFRIDGGCIKISLKKFRFSFTCLARDLKNSILNSLYQYPKNALRNSIIWTVDSAISEARKAGKATAEIAGDVRTKIIGSLDSWTMSLRQGIDLGWLFLALISLAGLAILLQAMCRALLNIFARLLVPWNAKDVHNEKNYFAMTPLSTSKPGRMRTTLANQGELELDLKAGEVFYVKHSLDVSNANRNVCLPLQPFSNPFARLVARRYFLKKLERNNELPLRITDVGSNRFVAIRLDANDRVAFRWSNFVGMTNNARLEYLFGLKLPMVALGLVRLPTIMGPGLLVLKVSGAATLAKRGRDSDSVAPYRLIAWDLSSGFRIASSSNFFSIYVDDCQIDVLEDDQAVIDIARDGRAMPGLLYQLWNIVRP
jgi:hypothetical protein